MRIYCKSANTKMFGLLVLMPLLRPSEAQFQATSFPQLPCEVGLNISGGQQRFLTVEAEDLASNNLNISGVFRRVTSFNRMPVYRKEFLYLDGDSMTFPGETPRSSRSRGVLRQSAWNIFMDNSGHWALQEDGYSLGYVHSGQQCSGLVTSDSSPASVWRYSSVTGFTMQIRLRIRELEDVTFPDFYQVDSAPLQINGFYARTSTFSSDAPIYRKPGLGNMQNYLFLYKGSWMVAKDPLSNSLTYRMFQQSQGSLSPLSSKPWNVVNNDGTIEERSQVQLTPHQQTYPPSYTLTSSGPVRDLLPTLLGHYGLSNISRNNVPVYHNARAGSYLYQSDDGSWVVSASVLEGGEVLSQDSRGSPLPLAEEVWRYFNSGWATDTSLRAIGEATPEARAAALRLGLSIGFPVAAALVILLIIIAICCCLRGKKTRKLEDEDFLPNATLRKVSKL